MEAETTPQPPSSTAALPLWAKLPPVPRFHHLVHYTKSLIQEHGPYTLHSNTTVLTRNNTASTSSSRPPSIKSVATSLAAAQDAHTSAQPDGPIRDDLALFTALAQTSVLVLEQILEAGIPDGEAFGWGVYSLSMGYMPAMEEREGSSNASSREDVFFEDDMFTRVEQVQSMNVVEPEGARSPPTFDVLQKRLRAALWALPGVNTGTEQVGGGRRGTIVPAERVRQLAKKRNEVHLCATLLVQRFRGEEWKSVRWGHLVAVVERWLSHLELNRS